MKHKMTDPINATFKYYDLPDDFKLEVRSYAYLKSSRRAILVSFECPDPLDTMTKYNVKRALSALSGSSTDDTRLKLGDKSIVFFNPEFVKNVKQLDDGRWEWSYV